MFNMVNIVNIFKWGSISWIQIGESLSEWVRFCLPFVSDLLISVKNVTNIVKISIIIANFVAKIVVKVVTGDKDCDDGDPLPPQAGWFEEGSPLAAHGSRSKIVFKIVVKFVANPDISV